MKIRNYYDEYVNIDDYDDAQNVLATLVNVGYLYQRYKKEQK